jgi:hypothetical protein
MLQGKVRGIAERQTHWKQTKRRRRKVVVVKAGDQDGK